VDVYNTAITPRAYDGTDSLKAANVTVRFGNLVVGQSIPPAGYSLTGATFNGQANVTTGTYTAKATVVLNADNSVARNYTMSSASFTKTGTGWITPRNAAESDFVVDTSKFNSHYFTNTARGVGNATFKTAYKAQPAGSSLSVLYTVSVNGVNVDTTAAPSKAGSYDVKVRVNNNANFNNTAAGRIVKLSRQYVIKPQEKPEITANLPSSDVVRRGKALVMTVAAKSPNGTAASAVQYQWYRNDTLISGATQASYTYNAPLTAPLGEGNKYFVWVKNNPGAAIQVVDSLKSNVLQVTVLEAAKSIEKAKVAVGEGEYIYSGDSLLPQSVTVTLAGATLTPDADYTYVVSKNLNAGTALVRVTGIDAYEGIASATFAIAKKTLEETDVEAALNTVYNGKAQPLSVTPTQDRTGLGAYTVTYNGAATVPTDAGTYVVKATFAAGANFTASEGAYELGDYVIEKRTADTSDITYTPWASQILVSAATSKGIGAVAMKAGFAKYGKVTVLYDNDTIAPTTEGLYLVEVEVGEGDNFETSRFDLGYYNLVTVIAVNGADRVVPGKGATETATVAPVAKAGAEFSAGPSPVSKNAGKIAFFAGKAVKSGKLFVFDASGNAVAKLSVGASGKGEIAAWNLRDKKGAPVAEGSYVVKGALAGKDGTIEKVGFVFSVVR